MQHSIRAQMQMLISICRYYREEINYKLIVEPLSTLAQLTVLCNFSIVYIPFWAMHNNFNLMYDNGIKGL